MFDTAGTGCLVSVQAQPFLITIRQTSAWLEVVRVELRLGAIAHASNSIKLASDATDTRMTAVELTPSLIRLVLLAAKIGLISTGSASD